MLQPYPLWCIRCLFLSLFRLVLRLSCRGLSIQFINLQPRNISLATRFLHSRTRFTTYTLFTHNRFTRMSTIIHGTSLLFNSIRLFRMRSRLLLRPITIRINLRLFRIIRGPNLSNLHTNLFRERSLFLMTFSPIRTTRRINSRSNTFLRTRYIRPNNNNFHHNSRHHVLLIKCTLHFNQCRFKRARSSKRSNIMINISTHRNRHINRLTRMFTRRLFVCAHQHLRNLQLSNRRSVSLTTLSHTNSSITCFMFQLTMCNQRPRSRIRLFKIRQTSFCHSLFVLRDNFTFTRTHRQFCRYNKYWISTGMVGAVRGYQIFKAPNRVSLGGFYADIMFSKVFCLCLY